MKKKKKVRKLQHRRATNWGLHCLAAREAYTSHAQKKKPCDVHQKKGGKNPMWDNNTFWRWQKKTQDHFLFLVVFLTIVAFVFSRQRYLQVNSLMMNEDHRSFRGKQKFVAYKNNIYEGEKRPERKRKRKREEKADIPYSFNNTQNPLPSQPQANSRPASPEKKKSHFALSLSLSLSRAPEKKNETKR